jgi:hypothetical protein
MSCFNIPGDMALNDDETDCKFVEGLEAVRQQIITGAQVFKGRWTYDANKGLDYLELLFEKGADLRLVKLMFYEFFLSVPGVASVGSADLRVDSATRTLYVSFVIETDFGPLADVLKLNFGA